MKTFKTFLREGSYPFWTKAVTAGLVLKVRNLSNQIERERDPAKQNQLIGQQNKLLGSRLIDRQSQNMTVAARATAERKVFAHLS